ASGSAHGCEKLNDDSWRDWLIDFAEINLNYDIKSKLHIAETFEPWPRHAQRTRSLRDARRRPVPSRAGIRRATERDSPTAGRRLLGSRAKFPASPACGVRPPRPD